MDITVADSYIAELQTIYQRYKQRRIQGPNKREAGAGSMFSSLFQRNPQSQVVHLAFLDDVERVVTELADFLAQWVSAEPERCREYAHHALHVLFLPKPYEAPTDFERFLAIAEFQGEALFPYASREELQRIYDEQLERTPKRFMLPNQEKMVKYLGTLLSESN